MSVGTLSDQFDASVQLVRALPQKGFSRISYEDAAKAYAYYKQAKFGECQIARPSFWDPVGRAKWDAWSNLTGMSKEEAMQHYVQYIQETFEKFAQTDEFREKHMDYANVVIPFCKAVGRPNPIMEANRALSGQEEAVTKSVKVLKVNGSIGNHTPDNARIVNGNGYIDEKIQGKSESRVPQKMTVRINGITEVNSDHDDSVALSHSIIENILLSGEEALKAANDDVVKESKVFPRVHPTACTMAFTPEIFRRCFWSATMSDTHPGETLGPICSAVGGPQEGQSLLEQVVPSSSCRSTTAALSLIHSITFADGHNTGYVYLRETPNDDDQSDTHLTDNSDDEIYCDSLGELPDSFTRVQGGTTPQLEGNTAGKADSSMDQKSPSKRQESNGNMRSLQAHSTPYSGGSKDVTGSGFEPSFQEKDSNGNTDLSSLSSGSGYEQVGLTESVSLVNGKTDSSEQYGFVSHVKDSHTVGDELAFLNDCRSSATRTLPKQKGGIKKRIDNQNHGSNSGTDAVSTAVDQDCRSNTKIPNNMPAVMVETVMDVPCYGVTNLSHSDERHGGPGGHRRNQHQGRHPSGHSERGQRVSNRQDGQSREIENRPNRSRETSSSSESDGSGTVTIGEKILHCLERLQGDVQGIKDRLTSIENSIKGLSVRPAPWWYKYLPSKTVACLVIWPLLLNIMFLYLRKRKKK